MNPELRLNLGFILSTHTRMDVTFHLVSERGDDPALRHLSCPHVSSMPHGKLSRGAGRIEGAVLRDITTETERNLATYNLHKLTD